MKASDLEKFSQTLQAQIKADPDIVALIKGVDPAAGVMPFIIDTLNLVWGTDILDRNLPEEEIVKYIKYRCFMYAAFKKIKAIYTPGKKLTSATIGQEYEIYYRICPESGREATISVNIVGSAIRFVIKLYVAMTVDQLKWAGIDQVKNYAAIYCLSACSDTANTPGAYQDLINYGSLFTINILDFNKSFIADVVGPVVAATLK